MYSQEYIDSFKEDYNKLPMRELMKKYDLSSGRYTRLKKELGLGYKKPVYPKNPLEHWSYNHSKFYYYSNGKYVITRRIGGKSIFYCSCKTEEVAKKTVELLKKCNWDKSMIPKIKEELNYEEERFLFKFKDVDFEQFKKDYEKLTVEEILEKHNIKLHEYLKIRKYLKLGKKKHIRKEL